ncbi:DUF1566 domain-containing protein [Sulfurimonas sp. SAG-AH-194-C21]|nr:DUF1566 domain-containing protein [Sulfurimonas sp. SAG-AH-194-C21]MDF1883840.1 DUF1566 domain-containing protein [Sulfurimonas sp. SAG-AH-194-C21]
MLKQLLCITLLTTTLFCIEIVIDTSVSKERKNFIQYEILGYQKPYVVLDGLMWQDNTETETVQLDWNSAKEYCQNLKLAGYDDWFLPDINQLKSTVDNNKEPLIKIESGYGILSVYWSSSANVLDSKFAWLIQFYSGNTLGLVKLSKSYVRCARAGQ